MKRILCILLICSHFLFGADYFKPERISLPIKMQTLVGETAINNVLMSYFSGTHEIDVDNIGTIVLTVNNIGIDIRGKDDVFFGYDLILASNFLSELSDIAGGAIRGEIPIQGAVSLRELQDAYVIVMNLGEVVDKILEHYHVTNVSIVSSLKNFFSQTNGAVELWKQKYSTLLDAYVNKLEKPLDLVIAEKELTLSIGEVEDNISLDLKLLLESEKQYFWIEKNDVDKLDVTINSNKNFQGLTLFLIYNDYSPTNFTGFIECPRLSEKSIRTVNLKDVCDDFSNISAKTIKMFFKLKTKHGGILQLEKTLK